MPAALPAFVDTLPEGVGRVSLPTPFRVGQVNCYVLLERPITVVDPGTLEPGSPARLKAMLGANGLRFDDIDQIIVTHHHADHCGAAAVLAARADARIVCGLPEVASLVEPPATGPRNDLLVRLGVPEPLARSLIAEADAAVARVIRRPHWDMITTVGDGDTVSAGGRRLRCLVTPGHADGHLSLWDPDERFLLSGDHLLARIIPVPSLDGGECSARRRSLVDYMESLPRFSSLGPRIVMPGHGRAFAEIDVLAQRLRAHSSERAARLEAILQGGPATPFELARRLQWQPEGARLVLGLAHTQGHLDLLEAEGRAIGEDNGGVVSYRLTG